MNRFIVAIIGFLFASCLFANELLIEDKKIQIDKDVIEQSIFKANLERQILRAWNLPAGSSGQIAKATLTLDEQGGIKDLVVLSNDFEMKRSIEHAIQGIVPIKLPPNLKLTENNNVFKFQFAAR